MVRLFRRGDRRREELLSAYVDGELTAAEEREVEEVLASSEDARRELAALQATVDLVGQLPELDLPRSFALDAAPKRRWTLWWPSVRMTGLATSVATMLLVGLVAGDMLNVLEQARFGADDAEYASDESAFTAAASAPAPEAMAGVAMDGPATPEPPMARAGRAAMVAPATQEPESAAAESGHQQGESSADAPVAAAAQALPAAPAAAVAKRVAEESDSDTSAPAAGRMMTTESSEEPETAEQQAMEDEAPETAATAASEEPAEAMQGIVAADESQEHEPVPSESPPTAMPLLAAEEAPDVLDDFADTEREVFELPLAELQIVTAITIVLLTGATLVAVLRRRRSVP